MHIRLIAPGGKMPAWVRDGLEDYRRRLPRSWPLEVVEIKLGRRPRGGLKGGDAARAVSEEGERSLAALRDGDRVVALDETGTAWSSRELAERLGTWDAEGRPLALVVGGPDGLDPRVRERAEAIWSLSPLTLPHGLVRVLVAEQLYRAWSLLQGHPYHRG